MTKDQQTLIDIRAAIRSLPPGQDEACKELAELIRLNVRRAGNTVGLLALALVGAEFASEP